MHENSHRELGALVLDRVALELTLDVRSSIEPPVRLLRYKSHLSFVSCIESHAGRHALDMEIIQRISTWIWGTPMLAVLVGGGLWLNVRLGFFPVTHFPLIMRETFGKIFVKAEGEGTISPFQATCSALASTVGGSNIIGVPVALAFGGPGAVFWMWMTAIIGATTKYAEIALGLEYRERNEEGQLRRRPHVLSPQGTAVSLSRRGLCAVPDAGDRSLYLDPIAQRSFRRRTRLEFRA